jgi:hypothetical protein
MKTETQETNEENQYFEDSDDPPILNEFKIIIGNVH